jgi:hypothetical protein
MPTNNNNNNNNNNMHPFSSGGIDQYHPPGVSKMYVCVYVYVYVCMCIVVKPSDFADMVFHEWIQGGTLSIIGSDPCDAMGRGNCIVYEAYLSFIQCKSPLINSM